MKISRRQLNRLIRETLLVEAKALTATFAKDLKVGLEKVISKNQGRTEPNILLPYRSGVNDAAHDKVVNGLQAFLKDKGNYNMNLDGDWGSGTTKALREFQKANLEKVDYEDGKLGPKTSQAILDDMTKVATSSVDSSRMQGIQGIRVEDSLFGFLTKKGPTIEEKENYLKIHKLSPEVRKAAEDYLRTLKMTREDMAMLKKIKYDADKKVVDDFMSGFTADARSSWKSAASIPGKFAGAIQRMYRNNPNSLKDTSQAISLGIRDLSKEQVAKIDIDNVKLKGLGIGGKKRLYVPMKDGHYYEFVLNNKGTLSIDRKKSNQYKIKDFLDGTLSEGRGYGESRGSLYRKRYRRY